MQQGTTARMRCTPKQGRPPSCSTLPTLRTSILMGGGWLLTVASTLPCHKRVGVKALGFGCWRGGLLWCSLISAGSCSVSAWPSGSILKVYKCSGGDASAKPGSILNLKTSDVSNLNAACDFSVPPGCVC